MNVRTKNGYRFIIEVLISGVIFFAGLLWIAPSPLFPMIMQDYGVERATVSFTTSVISLIMGASSIPAGIIASRIGLRKTFSIGVFLMTAGALTLFCSNITQLIATRVVIAIGIAMTFPIAGGMVMQWFGERELPLINGINMSMIALGNCVALFVGVPIARAFGWKATLALYGAIVLIFALAWLVLGKERKSRTTESGSEDADLPINIGAALKRKTTIVLGLTVSGPFIAFMAISSWLPTYYNEVFGIPLSQASSITGLLPFFGIVASIIGGLLPTWTGLRKPLLVIPGILIGFATMSTFLFNNLIIIYLSVIFLGLCGLIFMPSVFTIAMELSGSPREAAIVISAALALGNVAGSTGPFIVGFLTDVTGSYLPGFLLCSILSWSLLVGGLLLPETGPRAR